MPLSLINVSHLLLSIGLQLRRVCLPSETPLEKTKISFTNDPQLEEATELGIEAHACFSSQH